VDLPRVDARWPGRECTSDWLELEPAGVTEHPRHLTLPDAGPPDPGYALRELDVDPGLRVVEPLLARGQQAEDGGHQERQDEVRDDGPGGGSDRHAEHESDPGALTAHAYAPLDAYVNRFAIQEASLPFEGPDSVGGVAEPLMELMATGAYPHMVAMATSYYLQSGYDFGDESDFGLSLILDALHAATRSGAS
jgi:hypothetical protein